MWEWRRTKRERERKRALERGEREGEGDNEDERRGVRRMLEEMESVRERNVRSSSPKKCI